MILVTAMFTIIIEAWTWFAYYLFSFLEVIRGWLVRRDASHVNRSKKYPEHAKPRRKSFMKIIPEVQVIYFALNISLVFPYLKLDISIYLVIFRCCFMSKWKFSYSYLFYQTKTCDNYSSRVWGKLSLPYVSNVCLAHNS